VLQLHKLFVSSKLPAFVANKKEAGFKARPPSSPCSFRGAQIARRQVAARAKADFELISREKRKSEPAPELTRMTQSDTSRPPTLGIEVPATKFEFVINLQTARAARGALHR